MRLRADLLFDQEEVGLYFGIETYARSQTSSKRVPVNAHQVIPVVAESSRGTATMPDGEEDHR
jgi:hypothetical protein